MQCAVEIEQHPAMLRPASTIISARIIDRAIAAAVAEALERGAETRAGGQNALAYVSETDAPEGKQGAWELMALAAIAAAEGRGIQLFRNDSGKAEKEVR